MHAQYGKSQGRVSGELAAYSMKEKRTQWLRLRRSSLVRSHCKPMGPKHEMKMTRRRHVPVILQIRFHPVCSLQMITKKRPKEVLTRKEQRVGGGRRQDRGGRWTVRNSHVFVTRRVWSHICTSNLKLEVSLQVSIALFQKCDESPHILGR